MASGCLMGQDRTQRFHLSPSLSQDRSPGRFLQSALPIHHVWPAACGSNAGTPASTAHLICLFVGGCLLSPAPPTECWLGDPSELNQPLTRPGTVSSDPFLCGAQDEAPQDEITNLH